jgi:hypothetical protein
MLTVIVMFVFPLWAIAVLTIDFLVLFGLLTQSEFLANGPNLSGSCRTEMRFSSSASMSS